MKFGENYKFTLGKLSYPFNASAQIAENNARTVN